jgi:hypothetical protein
MQPERRASLETAVLRRKQLQVSLRGNSEHAQIQPVNTALNEWGVPLSDQELAAICLDEACIRMGWSDDKTAAEEMSQLGVTVSQSMVQKWRSQNARECPNQIQLTRLGPAFMRRLQKSYAIRGQWAKAALLDIAESLGELAEAVGE